MLPLSAAAERRTGPLALSPRLIRIDPERARSKVFQPLPLGRAGKVMPNRLWLPAMVTWRSNQEGVVTEDIRNIYMRYAYGGVGMIVLEAMGIRDVASGPLMRIGNDRYIPALRDLVTDLHAVGQSLVIPQIIDFLKISTRKPVRVFMESLVQRRQLPESVLELSDQEFEANAEAYLPDPRARHDFQFGYRQLIVDLDRSEIKQIPIWFAEAARRAKAIGFDGVELHFAHAYTMASFLSVAANQRTDEYGGSFENRLRLPREVIRAVREEVGDEFIVGCRYLGSEDILGEDGQIHGNTLDDSMRIGIELARAGLDFISVSRGGKFEDAKQPEVGQAMYPYTGHSGHLCMPRDKKMPEAVNSFLAAGIRRAIREAGFTIPVVTAGKIISFEVAERLLEEEQADVVGMARALLADPDLPRKWWAGADKELRSCVYCPYCEVEDQNHRVVPCTIWPKHPTDKRNRLIPGVWIPDLPSSIFTPFEKQGLSRPRDIDEFIERAGPAREMSSTGR